MTRRIWGAAGLTTLIAVLAWTSLKSRPTSEADPLAGASATEIAESTEIDRLRAAQTEPATEIAADTSPPESQGPDAGPVLTLSDVQRLGADVGDMPPTGLGPASVRLAQARAAIVVFDQRLADLDVRLAEAHENDEENTSEMESRLAAARRHLELARFAERAIQAEIDGHPF